MENKILSGYPSIDKPWLKHYRSDINYSQPPKLSAYGYLKYMNSENLDKTAIKFLGNTTTYSEMFNKIDEVAEALCTIIIKSGFDEDSVKNTVIDYSENNIALYAKPEKVLILDSFPLTTVGKVYYITLGEKAKEL